MFVPNNTGGANCTGGSVSQQLGKRPGILVSDDARRCPTYGRCVGRKGIASLKEPAAAVSHEGAHPASNVFERGSVDIGVHGRLSSEKTGLALVFVLMDLA